MEGSRTRESDAAEAGPGVGGRRAPQRATILGVPFDFVSYADVLDRVVEWRSRGARGYVCLSNPHSVMQCHREQAMLEATASADLVLPDGTGAVLAARVLGYPERGRVTGPQLMLSLSDRGRRHGLRHLYYGGAPEVVSELSEELGRRFEGLERADAISPPFRELSKVEEEEMVDRINRARPDIVWVGLGAPKQEKWMLSHRQALTATALIGVGAAFDFHSGRVSWAPRWMRRAGIEWVYRLWREPRRMWPRQLDSVRFAWRVLAQRRKGKASGRS